MNWDELNFWDELKRIRRIIEREREMEDKQKRIAKMRRKLDALQRMLDDAGIDTNKKPYMERTAFHYAKAEEQVDKFHAEELDRLFQTAYPVQTAGLSFHDIDCNEQALRDLPSSRGRNQVPNRFSIKQANRIFAHTFLEDCTSESCG